MPWSPPPSSSYVELLSGDYRLVFIDYPGVGRSDAIEAQSFTAERVTADLLAVADGVGCDRFCWWGFSWGTAAGLQLATRTDRVGALVCGGYPPSGEFHRDFVEMIRGVKGSEKYVTFYDSLGEWDEHEALRALSCPRLLYFGSEDRSMHHGSPVAIADDIRRHRDDLVAAGWKVVEIPEHDHSLPWYPEDVVPIVRSFLESVPSWCQGLESSIAAQLGAGADRDAWLPDATVQEAHDRVRGAGSRGCSTSGGHGLGPSAVRCAGVPAAPLAGGRGTMSPKRFVAVALIAVSVTLLNAAPSLAHTKFWGSSVSLSVREPSPSTYEVEGDVRSPNPNCKPKRTVVIRKKQAGADPVMGTATTNADGHYFVTFADGVRNTYTANVQRRDLPGPHGHICRSATSDPVVSP